MPNIFGKPDGGTGLTNPLTASLDAADFDILDLDTLYVDGIEPANGVLVEIKTDLDMNAFKIMDLADPVAGQDPVTLSYAETNFASSATVPDEAPYDVFGAFTDETSAISIGIAPMILPASRDFTLTQIRAFLTTPAGFANYTISDFRINGTSLTTDTCKFAAGTDTATNLITLATPINVSQGDRFAVYCNPGGAAAGLKVVFMGNVSI
tara:strand:- start:3274 stop:3900 length:627 start_codon:yes stop_codon:yes gene_type:complete